LSIKREVKAKAGEDLLSTTPKTNRCLIKKISLLLMLLGAIGFSTIGSLGGCGGSGDSEGADVASSDECSNEFDLTSFDDPSAGEGVYITRDKDFVDGNYVRLDGDCSDTPSSALVILSEDLETAVVITDIGSFVGQWVDIARSYVIEETLTATTACGFTFYKDTVDCRKFGAYICMLSESTLCLTFYEKDE